MIKVLFKKNYIFIPLIILSVISIINMQNAKLISNVYENALVKQLIWIILGLIILFVTNIINIKKIFKYSYILYIISIILLITVLLFGQSINGAKCWINIFGFSFQPSEFTKVTLLIMLISILENSKIRNIKDETKLIIKLALVTLIPSILVFLEPDTGAIISYVIILLVVLVHAKLNKWWYIIFILIIIMVFTILYILYSINQDLLVSILGTNIFYRIDRLINFKTGSGYQIENALTSIGNAKFIGDGLNKIILYIPEAPTDFIFAFSIGNFGIISGILIIISYFIMDIFLVFKNKDSKRYASVFISAYFWLLLFQQLYNISMNLGLLPIMGITLPFLSYGGTSIIINYIFLGIILNLLKQKNYIS